MGRTVILTEDELKRFQEKATPTKETFNEQIRRFLKVLIADPVHAEIPDSVRMAGVSKHKLLDMMKKIGLVEYSERLNDRNQDGSYKDKVTMKIKYKILDKVPDEEEYRVPKNKFNEKIEKLRIMIFERNVPEGVEEDILEEVGGGATGCCGITDGSNTVVMPLGDVIRRNTKTS